MTERPAIAYFSMEIGLESAKVGRQFPLLAVGDGDGIGRIGVETGKREADLAGRFGFDPLDDESSH